MLRVRSAEGIAPSTWILLSLSSLGWFAYGIGSGEVPVVINSGIAALLGTTAVVTLLVRPSPVQASSVETTSDTDLVTGGVEDVEVPLSPDRI